MGSCFSKKESEEKEKLAAAAAADSREPPAPESPQEEEKVKEVLSETPKPRPSTRRSSTQEQQKKELPKKGGDEPIGYYDQRSEDTLDVYSVSESFSASTPSLTEQKSKKNKKNEVEEEVEEQQHKRRAERSPARRCHHQRKRSFSGELQQPTAVKVGCRSGRSSPSPPVGRTHSAREAAAAAAARAHRPLSHSSHQCEKFRRDHSGDRSVRRSLSPAKKLAAAPDHRRSNGGGQCRGPSARCSPQRAAPAAEGVGGGLEEESLENPLVSLECFIFL